MVRKIKVLLAVKELLEIKVALGLIPSINNNTYSRELKVQAVEEYLAGNGSLWDISIKSGLRSERQLIKVKLDFKGADF